MRREDLDRRLGRGIVLGTSGQLLHEGIVRTVHPKTGATQPAHVFLVSHSAREGQQIRTLSTNVPIVRTTSRKQLNEVILDTWLSMPLTWGLDL